MFLVLNCRQRKRIKRYDNVNYDMMIKIQDWILKHSNGVVSPIIDGTLQVKDEETAKILFVSIFNTFILLT